jgi:transcriptional regulator with XRE-family HTH domain
MLRVFKKFFAKRRLEDEYWTLLVALDFSAALHQRMKSANVSIEELAMRSGLSPVYITRALNCTAHFTVRSMVSLAHALGQTITITMQDEKAIEPQAIEEEAA